MLAGVRNVACGEQIDMTAQSRLGKQFEELIAALHFAGSRVALIGGLALASHQVVRANRATLNLAEIREYFRLFERESLLSELLNEEA